MSQPGETDRIEKRVILKAPRARVWRAIADAEEFGRWFGCRLDGAFAAGRTIAGSITDPPGYEHLRLTMVVERIEPERLFAYRWHPYAVDPARDYTNEPMTRVELRLADAPGGTELTIVESGFDALPADRRAEALKMNDGGWSIQAERIARHVAS
jgi:uncharacterized protein YndB with AHSA1/START domain